MKILWPLIALFLACSSAVGQAERIPLQSPGYATKIKNVSDCLYVLSSSLNRTKDLETWERIFNTDHDRYLSDFAVSDDNQFMLISTGFGSIPYDGQYIRHYLSEDAGQSFAELTIPGWHDDFYREAISTPNFLWAIDDDSILRISTANTSLEVSALPGKRPNDVFQYESSVILNCVNIIWKSDDEGENWYEMSSYPEGPVENAMGEENHLFFEINNQWYYSYDFGNSWQQVSMGISDDDIPSDHEIVLDSDNMYLNSEVGIRIFVDSLSSFEYYLSKDTSFNSLAIFNNHFIGSPAYRYADQLGWTKPMASLVQRSLSSGRWGTVENIENNFCTNFAFYEDQIIKLDRGVTWFDRNSFEMDSVLTYTQKVFSVPQYVYFGTGATFLNGKRIFSLMRSGVLVLDLENLTVDTIFARELSERRAIRSGNDVYFGSWSDSEYFKLNLEDLQYESIDKFTDFSRCWSVHNDTIYSIQGLRIVRKPFVEDASFEYWGTIPPILVDTETRFIELRINDEVIILVSAKGPYGPDEKFFYHLFDRQSSLWQTIPVPPHFVDRKLIGSMDLVRFDNIHFFNFPGQGVWSYNTDSKKFKEIQGYGSMYRTINLVMDEDLYLGTYRGLFKLDLNDLLSSDSGESQSTGIKLYPNPADFCLRVELNDTYNEVFLKIRALDGRLILDNVPVENAESIHLPISLSNGVYFVELYYGLQYLRSEKLVIQR